ncbi:MAG: DUF2634 domain-containing protein [Psychrilyobacter sp.]|uniref:DUF2634 domain-containing protein n=1 Tax=Psychrilyobacter sp. TaxID=2586924 RepID=UPI003C77D6CC
MLPKIVNSLLEVYQNEGAQGLKKEVLNLGKDIAWDFEVNKTSISGGYPMDLIDPKEITKQWIKKVFETTKNKYMTYIINKSNPSFGLPLRSYIGNLKIPNSLILAEIEKEIVEMMMVFPYISRVIDVFLLKNKDKLIVFYTVITIDQELIISNVS